MTRSLCAYAITRDHELAPVSPAGIRLVARHGLALVVAEVERPAFGEPAAMTEDDPVVAQARRHDVVVRAVFEHQPVLPLRFGTLLRDDQAAVHLLANHHDEACAWLDRVAGHREWNVRARPSKPAEIPADGTPRRDRLAALARTRRAVFTAAEDLHAELSGHAAETAPRTRTSAIPLLDAAYLVSAARDPAFRAATARYPELAVEVTGPWPPYSFVRLELSAGETAGH